MLVESISGIPMLVELISGISYVSGIDQRYSYVSGIDRRYRYVSGIHLASGIPDIIPDTVVAVIDVWYGVMYHGISCIYSNSTIGY